MTRFRNLSLKDHVEIRYHEVGQRKRLLLKNLTKFIWPFDTKSLRFLQSKPIFFEQFDQNWRLLMEVPFYKWNHRVLGLSELKKLSLEQPAIKI